LIPGVNNNDPVPIFTSEVSGRRSLNPQVKAALVGGDYPGDGPLPLPQSLIQGFVTSQLSINFAGGESNSQVSGDSTLASLGTLRSPLSCHGLKLSPVMLSNGFEVSEYSTLLELSDQTTLVFVDECRTEEERAADMRALGVIYQRLYSQSEAPGLRAQITTDRGSVEKGQNPAYFVGEPITIQLRVDGAAQALVTIEDVLPDGRAQVFFRQTVPGNQTLQLNARITPPLGRESLRLTARAGEQTVKDQCSFTVFAAGGAPCNGGELLVRHAYSECNSDGFWHVVEDAYYACPPNGRITRFRVFDKKTEQRCGAGQAAPNPIGTLFKVADETCQAPVKVGTVVITECRNGLWDHATYTLFECLDKSRRVSRTPESSVTTGVRCTDAPPPPPIPQR
jgi:hypothetical protein